MFDLAIDREQRREKGGYVTPAQAGAFLQMARRLQLGQDTIAAAQPDRQRIVPSRRMGRRASLVTR